MTHDMEQASRLWMNLYRHVLAEIWMEEQKRVAQVCVCVWYGIFKSLENHHARCILTLECLAYMLLYRPNCHSNVKNERCMERKVLILSVWVVTGSNTHAQGTPRGTSSL